MNTSYRSLLHAALAGAMAVAIAAPVSARDKPKDHQSEQNDEQEARRTKKQQRHEAREERVQQREESQQRQDAPIAGRIMPMMRSGAALKKSARIKRFKSAAARSVIATKPIGRRSNAVSRMRKSS